MFFCIFVEKTFKAPLLALGNGNFVLKFSSFGKHSNTIKHAPSENCWSRGIRGDAPK